MRFLFVDRILKMEKGKCAEGIKNVSFSDEYLVQTVPNYSVLPRTLSFEAIAQLISWLVIYTKDFTVKPVAVMTAHTKFFGEIRPGDQLLIKAEIVSLNEQDALCKGSLEIDGKIIAELDNGICAFIPLDELENPSTVKDLYLTLSGDMTLEKFLQSSTSTATTQNRFGGNTFDLNLIDKVVDLEPGKVIRGIKSITMTQDFIVDHFPKRHVMPGTMIMETFVQLTERLLQESATQNGMGKIKVFVKEGHKIKFRQYVKPGDQMEVEISLLDFQDNFASIKAKATVDGKLVSSAKMEFDVIELPNSFSQ